MTFSLKELCREAQVTERTIRYYIQEGLLSPPEGAGPFARYNEQHLLRLRLIRRLKKEYLPLAEIRRRLSSLTPEELENLAQPEIDVAELDEEEADARNYLDRILNRTSSPSNPVGNGSQHGNLAKRSANPSWPAAPGMPLEQERITAKEADSKDVVGPLAHQKPIKNAEVATEIWHHITLAPGVVLQYRANDPNLEQRVQQLLAQAYQIFKSDH